jgi:integrase/recombinase XerD
MAQAATLDAGQLKRVLDYLKTRRHYRRNRTMILLTHWSMLRVGEVAALRYCDVMDSDGQILAETVLGADQTKGDKSRRIWFNERMRGELAAYVTAHKPKYKAQRLFYTQRSEGFTANTLTHIINGIYSQAGIANASSHSGRRSGLTTLADKGVSVRVLMALAGHSQIATTQRYIDLRPSVVRAAVELI